MKVDRGRNRDNRLGVTGTRDHHTAANGGLDCAELSIVFGTELGLVRSAGQCDRRSSRKLSRTGPEHGSRYGLSGGCRRRITVGPGLLRLRRTLTTDMVRRA